MQMVVSSDQRNTTSTIGTMGRPHAPRFACRPMETFRCSPIRLLVTRFGLAGRPESPEEPDRRYGAREASTISSWRTLELVPGQRQGFPDLGPSYLQSFLLGRSHRALTHCPVSQAPSARDWPAGSSHAFARLPLSESQNCLEASHCLFAQVPFFIEHVLKRITQGVQFGRGHPLSQLFDDS